MLPSAAVSFVEEVACDGLSEGEMMLLSKFEHAAHGFLSFRLASCGWRCLDGGFLGEGHGNLSQQTPGFLAIRSPVGVSMTQV
jgi:hypothetical protein